MKTTANNAGLPVPLKKLREIAAEYGTPFLLYDEKGLGISAKSLFLSCAAAPDASFYLPVRHCMPPMPFEVLSRCGVGVRCETPAELRDALSLGVPGDRIRYAARFLPAGVDTLLRELDEVPENAIVSVDVESHGRDFVSEELKVKSQEL